MNIRKITVLACLCSITFYLTSTVVDETEAVFSDQESSTSTITAAVVFPEASDELVEQAKLLSTRINAAYDDILAITVHDLSIHQAEAKLVTLQKAREEIKHLTQQLKAIRDQVGKYEQRAVSTTDKGSPQYVQAGLDKIQKLYETCNKKIDSQQSKRVSTNLREAIEDLKQKRSEREQTPEPAADQQTETTHKKNANQKEQPEKENQSKEEPPQKGSSTKETSDQKPPAKGTKEAETESTKEPPPKENSQPTTQKQDPITKEPSEPMEDKGTNQEKEETTQDDEENLKNH
ncbi:DUF4047 domain-containing protein [Halobacillus hunanensis]|uniref:DUF4047 domain-containing protein n=1 Tax=Halobacillus hunanensis TaxID=578214 RepID=UPI001591B502|nr:DUF4047 domain-containing protein [Halobacillus hunanensis]